MDWSGTVLELPPEDAPVTRAAALYAAGDYPAAAALLAPLAGGCDPEALRMLGMTRLRQGAPDEALALLEQAVAAAPQSPLAALHHGLALAACGQHQAAVESFNIAARLHPPDPAPWLNMSSSLLAIGDHAGAIRAARRGRLRGPAMAVAHYIVGAAYLAAGYLTAAAAAFRKTTRLKPDFADGWVNLGVVAYRQGDVFAAKQAMRAALRVDPGHLAARANLGSFMRLTGEPEAGEALLMDTVAGNPEAAAARINLAAEYLSEDRAAEALALLAGPVPAAMHQHAELQRALALLKLGRRGQAVAILQSLGPVPSALEPLKQWRLVLAAQMIGNTAEARRAAAAMDRALAAPAVLPEHRIMAHYDLAKFFSWLADPAGAFRHWQKGHDELAKTQPFSRAAHQEFVDACIEFFCSARFAGAAAANQDETPVFVVGMPRSGTTLIEQILSSHGQVHGAGERGALGQAFQRLGGGAGAGAVRRIAALEAPVLNEAATAYLHELHSLAPGAARIIDKMPGNFLFLGLMALLMPKARIISCLRDPRDIGLSIFTFRFYGIHPYAHNLADLGWYICQQRRLMTHWEAALPNPVCQVNLSDWVEDFDGTLRRVLAFLDLPYDPACERFYETERRVRTVSRAQVKEKVNARGIGRWRPYAEQLAPLIAELEAGGLL